MSDPSVIRAEWGKPSDFSQEIVDGQKVVNVIVPIVAWSIVLQCWCGEEMRDRR